MRAAEPGASAAADSVDGASGTAAQAEGAGDLPNLLARGGRLGRAVDRRLPIVPQIHDALRDAIVRVAVLPGQAISETEMAASFGVSRTPIREALIRLA